MSPRKSTILASSSELIEWCEDEGWLDDSVLDSVRISRTDAHLRVALRLPQGSALNRKSELFFEFSLVFEDAVMLQKPRMGELEVASLAAKSDRFGLVLDVSGH